MRNVLIGLKVLAFGLAYASPSLACSGPPSARDYQDFLVETVRAADVVMIADVRWIEKRPWGATDDVPKYVQELRVKARAGAELNPHERAVMEYSAVSAYLDQRIDQHGRFTISFDPPYAIDLFGPRALQGMCFNLPQTCPIDLKTGDIVAVALEQQPRTHVYRAVFCRKLTAAEFQRGQLLMTPAPDLPPDEMLLHFVAPQQGP